MLTCCPCKIIGHGGQELGAHVTLQTEMMSEWISVKKTSGESYIVRVSYNHMFHIGRNVPHCPIHMRGHSGLVYSLQWFEQFAENVLSGLQFCGLVYEGQSVDMCNVLHDG